MCRFIFSETSSGYAENYGSLLNFEQIGKFKSNPDLQDLRALTSYEIGYEANS